MGRLDKESRRIREAVEQLERFLQMVNTEYEMHFLGIVKRAPEEKARELKRMFADLEKVEITNTQLAFKLRVIRTRHNTLSLKWLRTMRQIEDGTYRRHRFMAKVHDKENAKKSQDSKQLREEIRALARGDEPPAPPAEEQEPPASTEPSAARRPAPRKQEGSFHAGSQQLFKEYMRVREELGESTAINQQSLSRTLQRHAAAIKTRYKARDVKFRVVVENGKSKVKAVPIK